MIKNRFDFLWYREKMRVGILGGTFNPPHLGHLILAEEVREKLNLDKVFFIPTNMPPHKDTESVSSWHRFNMVKLSIESNPYFEVLDLEIKRGGVSFTIDTVKELKSKFPRDDFYLIVGSDLASTFSTWKDFDELKNLVKIIVAEREKYPYQSEDFIVISITQIDVSSSEIRKMVKEGRSIRYLVKEKVFKYIKKHRIYK